MEIRLLGFCRKTAPLLHGVKADFLSLQEPGADRYILFCGPMFVSALTLSQPNFKFK